MWCGRGRPCGALLVVAVLALFSAAVEGVAGGAAYRVRHPSSSTILWSDDAHLQPSHSSLYALQRGRLEWTTSPLTSASFDLEQVRLVMSSSTASTLCHGPMPALISALDVEDAKHEECPFVLPGLHLEATYATEASAPAGGRKHGAQETRRRSVGLDLGQCATVVGGGGDHDLLHMGRLPSNFSLSTMAYSLPAEVLQSFEHDGSSRRSSPERTDRYFFYAPDFPLDRAHAIAARLQEAFDEGAGESNHQDDDTRRWSLTALEVRLTPNRIEGPPALSVVATQFRQTPATGEATRLSVSDSRPEEISFVTGPGQITTLSNYRSSSADRPSLPAADSQVKVSEQPRNFTRSLPIHRRSATSEEGIQLQSLRRSLDKKGFHREIRTDITLSARGRETSELRWCQVALMEMLPESVFVDKYQVDELHRFGGPQVLIFDEFDLEKPSSDHGARQGVVIVQTTTTNPTKVGDRLEARLSVVLPIHLRYQDPSLDATHRKFSIPPPLVYVRCGAGTVPTPPSHPSSWTRAVRDSDETRGADASAAVLEVWVPVGEKQKQGLVTIVTLLATTLGSAIVLLFLWSHRRAGKAKRE
ncbi:phosphatidylinositol glycan [Acanthamoeba castellanii str. Neff]|uniref:Phosphatidylinositol glycan n=1 Tax=Acanthamoeba castellanii (strain ATCC 30010 / Neff) TaxID=1257118 RepID=L8GJ19_ACACF|nr:phosphatidylinositol glycan [Acanthamoeba castellanii str. Neff]ELR13055.1 phosphatidylinositol glycan [Acanthamoeba castellanii str. Neff]